MARPKKIKTVKAEAAKDYTAKIRVLGKLYEATGSTITEAIANLKPVGTARGVALLTISTDENMQERILPPNQTMRLFSPSRITRELALKNTAMRFGV